MPHIASTLTCAQEYIDWIRPTPDRVVKNKSVTIKGGYGLANASFVTPSGAVITEVTEEQLTFLQSNDAFKDHEKSGFVMVMGGKNPNPEKIEKDMNRDDGSQPLKPSNFANDGSVDAIKVHTNG